MNKLIKFTWFVLIFLMLGSPLTVYAKCKTPERGPAGPPGPPGLPFVSTYGTWNIPGDDGVVVNPGDILPFSVDEISSGITNASGLFTFSRTGVYEVTFGIAPQEANDVFDIELNGVLVTGGRVASPLSSPQIVTVMFSASAGNQLVVRNNSANAVVIGTPLTGSAGTYISILQIQ